MKHMKAIVWLCLAVLVLTVGTGFAGDGDEHMPFGKPNAGISIAHDDYVCGYKSKMRCSLWVAYKLTPASFEGDKKVVERPSVFRDPKVKELGLTQPAGDAIQDAGYWPLPMISQLDAVGGGEQSEKDTYSVANMSVQKPNKKTRQTWKATEKAARAWATERGEVFVVCGPVFGPEPERTKPGMVAIPDAFYKIIAARVEGGEIKTVSYKIPQEGLKGLDEYVTTIDILEAETGINFLKDLENEVEEKIEAEETKTLSKPKPEEVAAEKAAVEAAAEGPAGQVWCDMARSFYYASGHPKAGQGRGEWMDESTAAMMGFKKVKPKK